MADQVVLLNKGRIEQDASPRAVYARPASTFAARFIGTPAMNLLRLDGGRIAGSSVAMDGAPGWPGATAAQLGVRPEAIRLALDPARSAAEAAVGSTAREGDGGQRRMPATVHSFEYLGADLLLRCQVGSETLTVRADGRHQAGHRRCGHAGLGNGR